MTGVQTCALPILDYVIAYDIKLTDLSKQALALSIGGKGATVMLTDDLKLVTHPSGRGALTDENIRNVVLKKISETPFPILGAATRIWDRSGRGYGKAFQFQTSEGAPYFAQFISIPFGSTQFVSASVAPLSDFLPDAIRQGAFSMALILAFVIAAGLFIALRVSRRFSYPLEHLAKESTRIGQMQLDRPITLNSRLREVRTLSDSMDEARKRLLQFTQALEQANNELEARVATRTSELEATTAELKESEQRLRQMLETSPIAIRIARDADGRIVFANRAYADTFKVELNAAMASDPSLLYQNSDDYRSISRRLHAGEAISNLEVGLRAADGTDIWVLAT